MNLVNKLSVHYMYLPPVDSGYNRSCRKKGNYLQVSDLIPQQEYNIILIKQIKLTPFAHQVKGNMKKKSILKSIS